MKFHTDFWFLQDKTVIQPGKNLSFEKNPEVSLKVELFGVGKKIFPFVSFYFPVYKMHDSCLNDSVETACLGKSLS